MWKTVALLVLVATLGESGKLSLTVHYPGALLKCPDSLLLAVNELIGWGAINYTSGRPVAASVMERTGEDAWWLGIHYGEGEYTKTIFSRYVLYNPCLLSFHEGTPVMKETELDTADQETPICTFGLCRNVGQGDEIYLSESGLSVFEAYPFFYKSEGEIRRFLNFPAPQLPGGRRDINVYVPPGLIENPTPRSVPVLYLFDGQVLPALTQIINTFLITGSIKELVIVGIPATANRTYELTPTVCQPPPPGGCNGYNIGCGQEGSGGLPHTLAFIEDNLHPFILSNLSISASEVSAAGWSFGGLAACESLYRSHIITKAYCGSPALYWNCNEFSRTYNTRPTSAVAYLDGGFGEIVIWQPAKTTFEHLTKLNGFAVGGNIWFNAVEGDFHERASWYNRMPVVFQTLYGQ